MKHSAGTLLYREAPHGLEVLIVHPAGNYNRHAPWSIPKGVPTSQETDLEVTARRETFEETGVTPTSLVSLGHSDYKKSRKRIHCFAGPAPDDEMLTPDVREVDQARFVAASEARELLHPDQRVFVDRLVDALKAQ